MSIFGKTDKTKIKTDEAALLIRNKEALVVDVRTPGEYDSGHIENAILLPLDRLSLDVKKVLVDKEAVIFAYCLSGSRSRLAVNMLKKMGYSSVHNLGGIGSWPYEMVR